MPSRDITSKWISLLQVYLLIATVIPVSASCSIKYLCCLHTVIFVNTTSKRLGCHYHITLRWTVRSIQPLLLTGFHAVNKIKKTSWLLHSVSQQLLIHSVLQHANSCIHETWCLIYRHYFVWQLQIVTSQLVNIYVPNYTVSHPRSL
jgi:hypothetical protein